MRYRDRLDLALIFAETEATAAGVFTTNQFCAAPVSVCREHLAASPRARAILVNAGFANACSGDEGIRRAREMSRIAAGALGGGVSPEGVLVASTGVIGPQILIEPAAAAMPGLVKALGPAGWEDAARAIMTTDTVPKMAHARVDLGGKLVTVGGIAKGSGMIAPDMATLLSFVCTDVAIDPGPLRYWLGRAVDCSFNAVTVDSDTSTNDTLLVLAGGRAGNRVITDTDSTESRLFGEALRAVLTDLARQLVLDGEGATKFIEIRVTGAPDEKSARTVALTIANSPLVKTAFFGGDANWGRIVAAAGRAGVPLATEKVVLFFDGVCVFRNGSPVEDPDVERKASEVFQRKEITVNLDLGIGTSAARVFTCDFSYDYVKINADYRS